MAICLYFVNKEDIFSLTIIQYGMNIKCHNIK